jgi:hypothetical protein
MHGIPPALDDNEFLIYQDAFVQSNEERVNEFELDEDNMNYVRHEQMKKDLKT